MITIDIPGGKARFYGIDELPPRRSKVLDKQQLQMGTIVHAFATAKTVILNGVSDVRPEIDGAKVVELDAHQAELIRDTQDLATWAFLQGWTLDDPLPADVDGLLDLDRKVYDALTRQGAKLYAEYAGADDPFEVNTANLEDKASPTGALGASGGRLGPKKAKPSTSTR